jgi:methylphosphotriester-DNA--protein-cysteine methyltransferase
MSNQNNIDDINKKILRLEKTQTTLTSKLNQCILDIKELKNIFKKNTRMLMKNSNQIQRHRNEVNNR